MGFSRWVQEFDVVTGADGYYALTVGPGEVFDLTITAPGYAPGRAVLTTAPSIAGGGEISATEVLLRRSSSVTGMVMDAGTGAPICGATLSPYVRSRLNKKPAYVRTRVGVTNTGTDGIFVLDGVGEGDAFFKIAAPGYAPTVVNAAELDTLAPAPMNQISLTAGGLVYGRVSGCGGTPLEGVLVEAILPRTQDALSSRSNLDGTFCLSGLPVGEIEIRALNVMNRQGKMSYTRLCHRITLTPGGHAEVSFEFTGSCVVVGRCTLEGRTADWSATVSLLAENGTSVARSHTVDSGYYRIDGIEAGRYTLRARSERAGLGGTCERTVELREGEQAELDLPIAERALEGRVCGSSGQPLDAAVVELLDADTLERRGERAVTDRDGRFALLGVEEGDYLVAARAEGWAESVRGPWRLGGAHTPRPIEFALRPGGIGRVLVRGPGNEPVEGASVLLVPAGQRGALRQGSTGRGGLAIFESLEAETLTVLVTAPGFALAGARLNAVPGARTDCFIDLPPGGRGHLRVERSEGGAVAGAAVAVEGLVVFGFTPRDLYRLGLLEVSNRWFTTDANGGFRIAPLPAGSISITVATGSLRHTETATILAGQENEIHLVVPAP